MARTIYWVSPHENGWKAQREGASQASNVYPTKEPAIERARELAKGQMPSQVRVQRADGTIETERTYGDDPHPPAG